MYVCMYVFLYVSICHYTHIFVPVYERKILHVSINKLNHI